MELKGKVALVTGGARGIGRAIVERLAAEGARVAINYRQSAEAAEALSRRLRAEGRQVEPFPCDISDPVQVEAMVDQIASALGPVEILVNNAGVAAPTAITELDAAAVDRVLGVNLKGTLLVTAAVARRMVALRSGRIVTISSVAGEAGTVDSLYATSKAGLLGMTRALARELGRYGILVNAVAPGPVDSALNDEIVAYLERRHFRGHENLDTLLDRRKATPAEVAEAVVFLVRHDFITGQTLHVNGGMWW